MMPAMTDEDRTRSQSAHPSFRQHLESGNPMLVCLIDFSNRILLNKRQYEWCFCGDTVDSFGTLPSEGVFVLSKSPSGSVYVRSLGALCSTQTEISNINEYGAGVLSASNLLAEPDCEDVSECIQRREFVFRGTRLRIMPVRLCHAMPLDYAFTAHSKAAEPNSGQQYAVELEVTYLHRPFHKLVDPETKPSSGGSRFPHYSKTNDQEESPAGIYDDGSILNKGNDKQTEAFAAVPELKQDHLRELEQLREENVRLNSALACIRDMMKQMSGPLRDSAMTLGLDGSMFDDDEIQTAVGIPITTNNEICRPALEEVDCDDWLQETADLSSRELWHCEHDNIDVTADVTGALYELNLDQEMNRYAQPSSVYRFKSKASPEKLAFSTPCGSISLESTAPVSPTESPSDSEGSRHRVKVAHGACCVIDYQGERPDALTEAAIERILDGPMHSIHRAARRDLARISEKFKAKGKLRRSQRLDGNITTRQMPQHDIETPQSTVNLSRDTEAEAFAEFPVQDDEASTSGTNSDESPMAPSRMIAALQSSSPNSANFLAQYMADQISCRASLPIQKSQKTPGMKDLNGRQGDIASTWKSVPSSVAFLKKSSFLLRRPVEDDLLYG